MASSEVQKLELELASKIAALQEISNSMEMLQVDIESLYAAIEALNG